MFKLNEKVVYPGYGVAQINEIIQRIVGGGQVSFMKLEFLFKDMTILVPEYNIQSIGLRYPSDSITIEKVLRELCNKPERRLDTVDFTPSAWNKRNKEYQLRIQSGNILELTRIYRDLMYISQQKDLSFGERALLQMTEGLISQEIQVARSIDRDQVAQLLRLPFKRIMIDDTLEIQKTKPPQATNLL